MDSPEPVFSFDSAQRRAIRQVQEVVEQALPLIGDDLELAGDRSTDPEVRSELYTAATTLRMQSRGRSLGIRHHFEQRVKQCRVQWATVVAPGAQFPRALQLEDDEQLDEQLMAAELALQIRGLAQQDHIQLGGRVATLLDLPALEPSQDDWQPLGARNLASCAVSALQGLVKRPVSATALRQAAMRRLPVGLSRTIEDVNAWLDGQGVAIRVSSVVTNNVGEVPTEAVAAVDETLVVRAAGAREAGRAPVALEATPTAQVRSGIPAGKADTPQPLPALELVARSAQILGRETLARAGDGVLQAVKVVPALAPVSELDNEAVAFAHAAEVEAYSRAARQAWFDKARERIKAAGAPSGQIAMLDVVASMFDYVIDESRMAPACKPLLWRLQQPISTLALLDSGFMGETPRSLRRLTENIAAISTAFADELTRDSNLFKRLETVVRAVEIIASALQTRSGVMAKQIDHEYVRATQGVTQLLDRVVYERSTLESTPGRRNRRDFARRPSREREVEVGEQLKALLTEKTAKREIPESAREFITNVWLRHMRTAALRDGEDSAEFKVASQVLDDLLWSIDGQGQRQSRRDLAQRIPVLIKQLGSGIRASGAKDDEYRAFMDELFLMHLRKMQKRGNDTTGVVLPEGLLGPSATASRTSGLASVPLLDEAVDLPTTKSAEGAQVQDEQPAAAVMPGLDGAGWPSLEMDTPAVLPSASKPTTPVPPASPVEGEPERKLLEVLSSLNLDDLPARPVLQNISAVEALGKIERDCWLQLTGNDGVQSFAKVAWVNHRRTVVLLMRHPDRKAMSVRMDDLLQRLGNQRASIIR